MKNKEIKQIINETFENNTPDLLDKIKMECKNTKQIEPEQYLIKEPKKRLRLNLALKIGAAFAALCIFFISGFLIGNINPDSGVMKKEASIYIDVNPSIEIQIDENNKVIDCYAQNEDGVKILEEIKLVGVETNTALYAIVGSMYTNGYLNSLTNSILVSVEQNGNTILLDDISKQIESVFKENEDMNCSIIAQNITLDDRLNDKAHDHKISIGKMHLIEKIIENNTLYTEENVDELATMTIHELVLIYQSLENENEDEVISGKPGGFIQQMEALNYVLEELMLNEDDLDWYDVIALYHHNEHFECEMIYLVTIKIKGSNTTVKYIVNCSTGEIMPEDTVDEWRDKIPNDGIFGEPGTGFPHK